MKQAIKIVVGVIYCVDKQLYLLSQRPQGKDYAGYWEFAGGKVEPNEELKQALKRELFEELNIIIDVSTIKLIARYNHQYEHALVDLNFYLIKNWQGNAYGKEGQILFWFKLDSLPQPLLPSLNNLLLNYKDSIY